MTTLHALPLLALVACGNRPFIEGLGACEDTLSADATCELAGFEDRAYDIVLPDAYEAGTPLPLLLALHGGAGNKEGAAKTTCAEGTDDATCLHALGRREGFAVVYPNGTPNAGWLPHLRGWNAGGGVGEFRCTSGAACTQDVDDVTYIRALLDDVESRVAIDTTRVYSTGLSNGGAMSHRLACELSERITAAAPIGGAMQFTTSDTCTPSRPVPVLHIHGTEDPCWQYEGGESECPTGQKGLVHVSVQRTLDEWSVLLGCGEATESRVEDVAEDGTTTTQITFADCELEHLKIEGGGHLWPNGNQYLKAATVGTAPRDWGNERIWAWLSEHRI